LTCVVVDFYSISYQKTVILLQNHLIFFIVQIYILIFEKGKEFSLKKSRCEICPIFLKRRFREFNDSGFYRQDPISNFRKAE